MMLRRSLKAATVAGFAISMFAPLAAAQVTPAMDLAPGDALVVGSIKSLKDFNSQIQMMAERLQVPQEAMGPLSEITQRLQMPGLNADGSAAFVVLPDPEDEDSTRMVMILPVTDLQALVRELGGEPAAGVNEVEIDGNPVFLKNLRGGFIAAGEERETVEAFNAAEGSKAKFEKMLGQAGRNLANSTDIYFMANIPALAPKLKQGIADAKEQAQMMAAMAGGAQQPDWDAIEKFATDFADQAQSAVFGLNIEESGLNIGFASNFAEGSEMAGYFQKAGNASQILSNLPNQPFLAAFTIDSSSPGIKAFFKRLASLSPSSAPGIGPMQISKMMEQTDGYGMLWGTTPALMGGLFLNTVAYYRTSEPEQFLTQMREMTQGLNKQTIDGITFQTTYQSGGQEINGRKVDVWSMKMQADPTHPASQQIAQMQMMMFGPTGLTGYVAKVDNGLVMTYSKNADLLTQAINAAQQGGQGLAQDAGVSMVANHLPEGRIATGYLGMKNILEVGMGFLAMMGGGADVEIPQDLPPVGFGMASASGGVHGQVFIPVSVIETVRGIVESMNQGAEMDFEDEETGQDEF